MRGRRAAIARVLLLIAIGPAAVEGQDTGAEPLGDDRLGLADLSAYAAALSGRPTAEASRPDDQPAHVDFRVLWDRPGDFLGRRVTIRGRLERTFRQGPVGTFPPLAESWIFSAAGDPICIVYPRPAEGRRDGPGRVVQFTGTFLKTVRYAGGDGDRLAPLIVGDRPPAPDPTPAAGSAPGASPTPGRNRDGPRPARDPRPRSGRNPALAMILAVIIAMLIASRHIRGARIRHRLARGHRLPHPEGPDPPLRFVDSPDDGR